MLKCVVIATSVLFSLLSAAFACSCIGHKTVEDHYASVDVIFRGVAKESRSDISDFGSTESMRWMVFRADEVLKGEVEHFDSVDVLYFHGNSGSCGLQLEENQTYEVFASYDDKGRLRTGLCSGTRLSGQEVRWTWKDYRKVLSKY